jgi:hypothetical protein
MGKKFWTFITYLFHPALMPTLGTFLVLWNDPNIFMQLETEPEVIVRILAVVFLCTCILPVILSLFLLKLGRISSISKPTESDRRLMLSFTCLFFIYAFYCYHDMVESGKSIWIFLLGINISIVTTLITTLFTKVSFHSVGVGGLLGTVIGLMRYTHQNLFLWLAGAFLILMLTAMSRYKLKAHGAFEIYLGLIIGIATQALVFFFSMFRV